jgi:FkbM family methyltransferase
VGSPLEHHPVFAQFERWRGIAEPGVDTNFLGVRTRHDFYLTGEQQRDLPNPDIPIEPALPVVNEEYFEWIDVLEAVEAATRRFTMMELGAGWGRWLMNGAAAARQRGLDVLLVGVEAEPSHFRWMVEHFRDNDVPSSALRLHEAAVAAQDGAVTFHVGDPVAWYGQAIDPYAVTPPRVSLRDRLRRIRERKRLPEGARALRRVRALSLSTLLRDADLVDLIDLDIQGAEADVLAAAENELHTKVKRVHIGTHSVDNEERCRTLFARLAWEKRNDYASGSEVDTPYGRVSFQDGVQTWINPRLRKA